MAFHKAGGALTIANHVRVVFGQMSYFFSALAQDEADEVLAAELRDGVTLLLERASEEKDPETWLWSDNNRDA